MDSYEVFNLVGEGSFGRVYRAREKSTNETVALKVISKNGRSEEELILLHRECEIQKPLIHPNIIHMKDSFETDSEVVVVTEYCKRDLYIILGNEGYLSEDRARFIVRDLVSALHYLHSSRVLHRDLKPQNVLVDERGVAKLCDFGFARSMSKGTHVLTSIKGTPLYMAPELIEEVPYDHKADLWSLGCIVYEMLVGCAPFTTTSILHLVRLIRHQEIKWPDFLSAHCQHFLRCLLVKDPAHRADWPELLHHPYLVIPDTTDNDQPELLNLAQASNAGHSKVLARTMQQIEEQEKKLALMQERNTMQSLRVSSSFNNIHVLCAYNHSRGQNTAWTRPDTMAANDPTPRNCLQKGDDDLGEEVESDDERLSIAAGGHSPDVAEAIRSLQQSLQELDLSMSQMTLSCECEEEARRCSDVTLSSFRAPSNPDSTKEASDGSGDAVSPPLEAEEWLAFLQSSMEEVMDGDVDSVGDKGFITMVMQTLTNQNASCRVIEYIACLLSLPFVADPVSQPELQQIKKVYMEVNVVASLVLSTKQLLESEETVDVSTDQLDALEHVCVLVTHLIYANTTFLEQFCDAAMKLKMATRFAGCLALRRRRVRIVTDLVAILCHVLRELPDRAVIVEQVVLALEEPESDIHSMLTHTSDHLRQRTCLLLRLMAKFCTRSLRSFWTEQLKNDIESLAYDSIQIVRTAAEEASVELSKMPLCITDSE